MEKTTKVPSFWRVMILPSMVSLLSLGGCASTDLNNFSSMGNVNLNSLAGLTGGSSENKYSRTYISTNLIKGKTSASEVQQKFGSPADAQVISNSGKQVERWSYMRSKEGLSGLMEVAKKYVSADKVASLNATSAKLSSAQGTLQDVSRVAGGASGADASNPFNRIEIELTDGVVTNYSLY